MDWHYEWDTKYERDGLICDKGGIFAILKKATN